MIGATAFPSPGGRYRRVYKGSEILTVSGTWAKADAMELEFLAGIDLADVEVDVVAIGGGQSGTKGNSSLYPGGLPGNVGVVSVPFNDLPDTVSCVIGAGGAESTSAYGNSGGDTAFGSLVNGTGGDDGRIRPAATLPGKVPGSMFGPGAGAPPMLSGGAANCGYPAHTVFGGAPGLNGNNGEDAFSFGSGGGGSAVSTQNAGNGGAPGGGGGSVNAYTRSGKGGRGGIYLRYYAWEPAT